jgi:hypothetical protein
LHGNQHILFDDIPPGRVTFAGQAGSSGWMPTVQAYHDIDVIDSVPIVDRNRGKKVREGQEMHKSARQGLHVAIHLSQVFVDTVEHSNNMHRIVQKNSAGKTIPRFDKSRESRMDFECL